MLTPEMRRKAHSASANKKRAQTLAKIARYRKLHHIPHSKKLTPRQHLEARGELSFKPGARTVSGSMSLDAIAGRHPDKVRKQIAQRANYVTTARVQLADKTVTLVDRALRNGDRTLAGGIVMMVTRLLNGS